MKGKQKGYVNLDFSAVFVLAGVGLCVLLFNLIWLIIWIIQNVKITIG